jgi:hypothetical protein
MMRFDGTVVLLTEGRDCLRYRDEVRTAGVSVAVVDINSKSCGQVAEHMKSRGGTAINVVVVTDPRSDLILEPKRS